MYTYAYTLSSKQGQSLEVLDCPVNYHIGISGFPEKKQSRPETLVAQVAPPNRVATEISQQTLLRLTSSSLPEAHVDFTTICSLGSSSTNSLTTCSSQQTRLRFISVELPKSCLSTTQRYQNHATSFKECKPCK